MALATEEYSRIMVQTPDMSPAPLFEGLGALNISPFQTGSLPALFRSAGTKSITREGEPIFIPKNQGECLGALMRLP